MFKYFPTVYELEPQKVTGIVKYVGRIDSEFVDTRMYVGVKLDEPCKCQWHHLKSHDLHFFTTQMETQMVCLKESDTSSALQIMANS